MDGSIKGGLILGLWLLIAYLGTKLLPPPQPTSISWLFAIGSFVLAVVVANFLDKSIITRKKDAYVTPLYPENWEEIRSQVLSRDGFHCGNCGSTINLHVHHIVPLSKGGTNQLSNLRTLCKDCHMKIHPHMK